MCSPDVGGQKPYSIVSFGLTTCPRPRTVVVKPRRGVGAGTGVADGDGVADSDGDADPDADADADGDAVGDGEGVGTGVGVTDSLGPGVINVSQA